MDWTKQADEMIKTWKGAQQRMIESWMDVMKGSALTSDMNEGWKKALDAWQSEVHQALDAQTRWTQAWADTVSGSNSSAQLGDMARQGVASMKGWTDAQGAMFDRWVEMVRQADPQSMATMFNSGEAQRVMGMWQEAATKAAEAQQEWMRMLSSQAKETAEKTQEMMKDTAAKTQDMVSDMTQKPSH